MMLVTRPNHDPATRYLSAWSLTLISEAKAKNIEVLDLTAHKAIRIHFEGRMKKKSPSFVLLNGHGSEETVTGQNNEVLVRAGENAQMLAGKVTYAVSCDSAARLGKEVGAIPDSVYIGYEKEFAFLQSHGYFGRPSSDPLAKPFMEFSNQVVRGLLKGHEAGKSVERAKEVGRAELNTLLSSSSDPNAQMAAAFLSWDIKYLTCSGVATKRAYSN
ncbi:hypothetical protein A3E39_00085 [Candidatus Uhrbacteria bacterium RIFCSPHIGHO2_12_FULL_60_25]|uniref:CHAT domain-containing protein n=1 Tax=Candidatus Uhrbacteria bacterium RIFCSPHIGHO2_12_FULL_60_25 TaxID=1802399 RepID=A0A1F7UMP3_9BACT|nr:MAG: hypothetical protein A3D73_02700 [Candidatus Uhrbacteria bacterium RIFCSPHIGHO2_02_FULL_60_44]OGL79505.1 MAG: hypothetical protein A3E39_00085 [Candidatus Uhrbacteria bacterium RIFCSPHIGHO2_12_FULL_60_25]